MQFYIDSNRIGKLGCGYQGSGLVCCPNLPEDNFIGYQGRRVDAPKCGQSAIQGFGYQGIGAYPFVARVGFKSEFSSYIFTHK